MSHTMGIDAARRAITTDELQVGEKTTSKPLNTNDYGYRSSTMEKFRVPFSSQTFQNMGRYSQCDG
jgi:hypothetical protein